LRHLQADRGQELGAIGLEHLNSHHGGYGKRYAAKFDKLEKGYVELRHFGVDTFRLARRSLARPLASSKPAAHSLDE
jgi:hypothetical protein